jgi:hypothetical protein
MNKRVIGVSLRTDMIGVAGSDGLIGQKSIGVSTKTRSLTIDTLLDLKEYFDKTLTTPTRRYNVVAVAAGEYSINVKGFAEADLHSKMVGALSLIAADHGVKICEVCNNHVSELAIGRKKASLEDYRNAAVRTGVKVNGLYAAEAFWIMLLASKEM